MPIHYSVQAFDPEIIEAYSRLFSNSEKSDALLGWRFER
jgi:hypothetical protein